MRLRLYLDYCAYDKDLAKQLQVAGHHVKVPPDFGIDQEADDIVHFRLAAKEGLVLITKDAGDFEELHQRDKNHAGIFIIREDADYSRNMSYADIVRAIGNLADSGITIPGDFHILNHWQFQALPPATQS